MVEGENVQIRQIYKGIRLTQQRDRYSHLLVELKSRRIHGKIEYAKVLARPDHVLLPIPTRQHDRRRGVRKAHQQDYLKTRGREWRSRHRIASR